MLLLQAQPVHAGTWVENVVDWFTELFSVGDPSAQTDAVANVDSLRATPLGVLLNEVTRHDTLAIEKNWPYPTVDAAADLDRHVSTLRNTILLTDPADKLPLRNAAVRVVYPEEQRPGFFLDMLTRFVDVQEVVYSSLLPETLPVSDPLPTVLVVTEPSGRKRAKWYQSLATTAAQDITLLHFGDLKKIAGVPAAWSVITTPFQTKESEAILAQALVGAETLDARVTENTLLYPVGTGYRLSADRPGFSLPEQLGIDRAALENVDYQINRGIRYRAMPGAQLLVMKNGRVVYEKAYGHHTYRKQAVTNGDLYDLASITKAAATSLAVMSLYDEELIELNKKVRDYLPEYKKSLVGRYTIEQLLTHQTGLQSNLPVNEFMTRDLVADDRSFANNLPLGPDRWLDSRLPNWVAETVGGKLDRTAKPAYVYSDVNYYLLQRVVEAITRTPLDIYVTERFYEPMGLGRLAYNPHASFPAERLVPTITEPWMRGGLLRGFVHDEGAALLGGVSGHAGLFGNAHDLGQLFQLLNNGGTYAGKELLSAETVATFTDHNRFNYRALGFDRLAGRFSNAHGIGAGTNTVGHLGYTGTSVWADPENDLVFVLLTNRVNPDPKNEKFLKMDIRSKVTSRVYRALGTWELDS
ncbi:hypothetical protein A3850_010020 [Lewinella sp. 4G2]|nr:hypothetical protein A3850_010020 [Lewinella sp. 4G2]